MNSVVVFFIHVAITEALMQLMHDCIFKFSRHFAVVYYY